MTREFLSYDPLNGITQYHNYDPDTDISIFESVGDAEPVLEFNRKVANNPDISKAGIKQGWWWYAQIPVIFQLKLLTEKGIDVHNKAHAGALSKILEDPEYSHLKMTTKRHLLTSHD